MRTKNTLFDDPSFGDKEYFQKYPTIFHLRAALTERAPEDIRLLYLAVHHIVKNRGHFLFEGQAFQVGDKDAVRESFQRMNGVLSDLSENAFALEELDAALAVLCDASLRKTEKQGRLERLLHAEKNEQLKTVIKGITGGKIDLNKLYQTDTDYADKKTLAFDSSFDEETIAGLSGLVGDDESELLYCMKRIYDWSVLTNILEGETFISVVKRNSYNRHAADLQALKDYVKQNCPEKYKRVFRRQKDVANYAAYVGVDGGRRVPRCGKDAFYDFLKKELNLQGGEIADKIEKGTFLPKQISNENGVIPYQVHYAELEAILDKAAEAFPFLSERADGMTVKEKILSLLCFRIPYYVGPLSTKGKFSWMKKFAGKETVKVTPWNFDSVVDKDASEEAFIARMPRKCTYLTGEDV